MFSPLLWRGGLSGLTTERPTGTSCQVNPHTTGKMWNKIWASYSRWELHYCWLCIPPTAFGYRTGDLQLPWCVWPPPPLKLASSTPAVPPRNELWGSCFRTRSCGVCRTGREGSLLMTIDTDCLSKMEETRKSAQSNNSKSSKATSHWQEMEF